MSVRERLPRAIVFDMDGTLLDTEVLALRAWEESAAAAGTAFGDELARALIGKNFADSSAHVRAHFAKVSGGDYPVDAVLDGWHRSYERIVEREGVGIKDGARELLAWLAEIGIPCAVATSTRRASARHKLEKAGLLAYFKAVIGGDDVVRGKPAPDIYLAAAQALATPPSGCLAIEDSETGYRAAHAAGMAVILVPDLMVPNAQLLALSPQVVQSLAHVQQSLEALAP